jgi:Ca2+-binding RTX toxin-like protein
MNDLMESLEGRALLASVGLNTTTGVLTITGNSTADRIEVQRRADKGQLKVEVNGSEKTFKYSAVKKIVINASGGNDFVESSGRDGGVTIPMSINGGDGNDTLQGGLNKDTILGGSGNDRIQGKSGNDSLLGGSGNDFIEGGDGNDIIKGEAGNDDLYGSNGNDRVEGGDGEDDIFGNAGDDSVFGGGGNDDFFGDNRGEQKDRGGLDDPPNHN